MNRRAAIQCFQKSVREIPLEWEKSGRIKIIDKVIEYANLPEVPIFIVEGEEFDEVPEGCTIPYYSLSLFNTGLKLEKISNPVRLSDLMFIEQDLETSKRFTKDIGEQEDILSNLKSEIWREGKVLKDVKQQVLDAKKKACNLGLTIN